MKKLNNINTQTTNWEYQWTPATKDNEFEHETSYLYCNEYHFLSATEYRTGEFYAQCEFQATDEHPAFIAVIDGTYTLRYEATVSSEKLHTLQLLGSNLELHIECPQSLNKELQEYVLDQLTTEDWLTVGEEDILRPSADCGDEIRDDDAEAFNNFCAQKMNQFELNQNLTDSLN